MACGVVAGRGGTYASEKVVPLATLSVFLALATHPLTCVSDGFRASNSLYRCSNWQNTADDREARQHSNVLPLAAHAPTCNLRTCHPHPATRILPPTLLPAFLMASESFSLSNLAEWTPTTEKGLPWYLRSRKARSGRTCMQLMQQ